MQKISDRLRADTMHHRGIPVFTYEIHYPFFSTDCSTAAADDINAYYNRTAQALEIYCRSILYPQAVDAARYIPAVPPAPHSSHSATPDQTTTFPENPTAPFNPYELLATYKITYNSGCITSLYLEQYTFMGGAHGATLRSSDTWEFSTGARLHLANFFPFTENFPENILQNIKQQISERLTLAPSTYFDNYSELLRENFNPQNFYLRPGGIIIYYQQYDIAPYASGIPEFFIHR